ncbi:hypothetical protein YQE_02570, partial [Dendroctonus ponderosae]
MMAIREELENVQKKLKLQSKRCRQLVSEYTRKLQEKDQLYLNEKTLRDNQLAKVLKALLIFEARLKQEQKLISHQLSEKDYIISKQGNDIKKLLDNQYCRNCNKYYTLPVINLESFDSGSEYVATEPDYQSSNLESLDSSTENYAASSERDYPKSRDEVYEPTGNKHWYGSQGCRKVSHKKCAGSYFQILKLHNESPNSNDDNTSADYDNLDSLPTESVSDKISELSENIDNMLNKTGSLSSRNSDSSANVSSSECDKTVINTVVTKFEDNGEITNTTDQQNVSNKVENNDLDNKLTETMPLFESGGDTNDNCFDNLQNLDKHLQKSPDETSEHPCFKNFELSQNFEEFKLDDCEIEEYDVEEELRREDQAKIKQDSVTIIDIQKKQPQKLNGKLQVTMVDYIRATDNKLPNSNQSSLDLLKKLELGRSKNSLDKFASGERKRAQFKIPINLIHDTISCADDKAKRSEIET